LADEAESSIFAKSENPLRLTEFEVRTMDRQEGVITTVLKTLERAGELILFAVKSVTELLRAPFEGNQLIRHIADSGAKSLPLVIASGLTLGAVMTLHTRSTLVKLGGAAMIPTVQAVGFFVEIGPLVTGLLIAGRVGSGIAAVLANMRATEQIDAVESLSIDSFAFLVVPRVLACVISMPILTLFMDFTGLLGGFVAEYSASHISFSLYLARSLSHLDWVNFVPPTIKTAVFGLIIGAISSFYGFTSHEGSQGVGRASTDSVVLSSLMIILADFVLTKCTFFAFPGNAL
jgi:phospholipid/cholesterol/gamma-HCH transport system permease protein